MPVQGSSWDAFLAIITANSFDRKGKQERKRGGLSLCPRSPRDPLRLLESVFSIMAPMYILSKLIYCQQLMQSRVWRAG